MREPFHHQLPQATDKKLNSNQREPVCYYFRLQTMKIKGFCPFYAILAIFIAVHISATTITPQLLIVFNQLFISFLISRSNNFVFFFLFMAKLTYLRKTKLQPPRACFLLDTLDYRQKTKLQSERDCCYQILQPSKQKLN